MKLPVHLRAAVTVFAVGLGALVVPASVDAQPGPSLDGQAAGTPTSAFDGSKRATDSNDGAQTNAVGDVTISSQGCSPDPVGFGAQTTCTYAVQNQTQTATTVDLQATGDSELAVVGADQGAAVNAGTARAEDVALPPRTSGPIQVNPGNTFAGYYALETIQINPQTISDDQILNYTVQPYRWNGATYTSIGISANGYAVVGGADTTKDATASPQDVPNAGRPNNVLAPFWTDLTPAGGGTLRVATVANTAQPPCERSYWFVAQWDMFEYGTTTNRKAQLWIQADDPECATDPVPAETVYFTYDFSTMTAAPVRPFRIGAENSTGTVGGMRPAGQLPTSHYVVTSSGTVQPAPVVTWTVTGQGQAGGTGTVAATVESSLIPGSSTVFTDVTVNAQDLPTITDQPDDTTVTAKQQAVFTAAATGASSVRWQVSTDGGGSWNDIPGASATTLSFTAHGGDDGNQYHAIFANSSGGESTTDAATLTVDPIATTTSVEASPASPSVGQAASFTATIAPSDATGTVQFVVDGTPLGGPVAVSGGTATSPSTSSLAAGDHTVTATYSGDTDHDDSIGNGAVSVGKVASSVGVTIDPAAPVVGDDVDFTATVTPSAATGTVQFKVDGTTVGGPVSLAGGTASVSGVSGLGRGSHTVEAVYSGSATYATSTTGLVTFAVGRTTTSTSVAVDPAAPKRGEDVDFTATVTPTPGGGTVQFTVDGNPFGDPVAVGNDGTATSPSTDSLSAGSHTVSAAFSGSETHAPSSSGTPTSFTVAKRDSSTTVIDVRPEVLSAGEDVTVDLTVSPAPAGGSVQPPLDGTDVGGPITLNGSGEATATLPDVAEGTPTLTATFSGDDDLLPSSDTEGLTVYEPNEAFVRRAYLVILGRPGDPSGVAHHVALIEGGMSPEAVTVRLANGSEGRRRLVEGAYQQVLQRPADPSGRSSWVTRLGAGASVEDLYGTLIGSSEAYRRGGGDPNGVVATLYRVHLGRPSDSSGRAYWSGRIASSNTPAGRRLLAIAFARNEEATRTAVTRANTGACGSPTSPASSTLEQRWVGSGHNPLQLLGSALALSCPPEGLTA